MNSTKRVYLEMNDYQLEQLDALSQLQKALTGLSKEARSLIQNEMTPYLKFRNTVDRFTRNHFGSFCTSTCFQNQKSACCSKDGIITFWADMVVNAFCSSVEQMTHLRRSVQNPFFPKKCIYLTSHGCLWEVRPLVCAFFLCDPVVNDVLMTKPPELERWNQFKERSKSFRWPDKQVLFDRLETVFIDAGCDSTLMYLNKSPGLLRVKKRAGLL